MIESNKEAVREAYSEENREAGNRKVYTQDKKQFNLELINLIQNGIAVSYNLGRLYENNLGFIYEAMMNCNVSTNSDLAEDLAQIAFFAIYDSAIKYDITKGLSYLSYLNLWLIHYFFQELLRMKYSFRITNTAYYAAKRIGKLSDFYAMDLSYLEKTEILDGIANGSLLYTIRYEDFYNNNLTKEFWKIVENSLSKMNYEIIVLRFKDRLKYAQIAEKYSIGKDRVRMRVIRSLRKLKNNVEIQVIAEDWYNIDVARSLREDEKIVD